MKSVQGISTKPESATNAGASRTACAPTHPLEALFPFFRRYRPGLVRDLVYTLIWSTMIGAAFAVFAIAVDPPRAPSSYAWGRFAASVFVIANCIGFAIHAEFAVVDRLFPALHRQSVPMRAVSYAVLSLLGVFAGWWFGAQALQSDSRRMIVFDPTMMLSIGAVTLIICAILLAIFIPRERAANAQAAIERERARVAAAEREATLARLKTLEAQIEPHFLYNTLANAVSLVDSDPAGAKRMLDRLIELLRAAAGSDRVVTLARQVELVAAYLEIVAVRMGPRLEWSIDVAPDAAALPVPPMLLQPIVENAVKHGLEPKLEGGRVDVVARRNGSRLDLVVSDSGLGFGQSPAPGSGVGLTNLRARLAALYGAAATVTIEDRAPCGTRVAMSIPIANHA